MSEKGRLFTSESVTEGHPDKICDAISDSVLDALLAEDPRSRVAVETLVTTGQVHVVGEVTTNAKAAFADITNTVRARILDIGYDSSEKGFDGASCGVNIGIGAQSPDIAQGVDTAHEARVEGAADPLDAQGAGDQGLMFGFACNETPELMPTPIMLAHRLGRRLTAVRKSGKAPWLRPDAKSQVSVRYVNGRPTEVVNVVVSTQHTADVAHKRIRDYIIREVIKPVIPARLLNSATEYLINPTGRFVVGGPEGDSGLTGRKIIVDTYGGWGRHGGGAFSGKDPSKVDRSAAYMCRWVAKNIVAAGLASAVELQVAYAIGHPRPVSICVDTRGTGRFSDEQIARAVSRVFSFKPADIIGQLNLLRPIYRQTTNYGHFGKAGLPWEKANKTAALLAAVKK